MARKQPPRPPKEEKPPVNFQYDKAKYSTWLIPPRDEAKARRDVINAVLMVVDIVGSQAYYEFREQLLWIQHFEWFCAVYPRLWENLWRRVWLGTTGTATAADFDLVDLPTEPAISHPIP